MKNELIIASYKNRPRRAAQEKLQALLDQVGLEVLRERFFVRDEAREAREAQS